MTTKKTDEIESTSAGNVLREAAHKMNEMGEHAGKKTDELIHNAENLFGKYQKEVIEYSDTLGNYIKKNPLKSALIAGGIGLILGRLLKS